MRLKLNRALSIILILWALTTVAHTESLTGKVVSVKDGDTIEILVNNEPIRIRLYAVDCPEKSQAFGQKAKQFTSDLCYGKTVSVKIHDKDRYGRLIGEVFLPDGKILNNELLKAGYAWHYKQYNQSPILAMYETEAKKEKRGLWSDPNSIPPWEFRHSKKSSASITQISQTSTTTEKSNSEIVYITKTGKRYHREGCSALMSSIAVQLKKAKEQGYTPCKICNPPE